MNYYVETILSIFHCKLYRTVSRKDGKDIQTRFDEIISIYKSICLLNKNYNEAFRFIVIPFIKFSLGALTMILVTGLIRLDQSIFIRAHTLLFLVICPIFIYVQLLVASNVMSSIFTNSDIVKENLINSLSELVKELESLEYQTVSFQSRQLCSRQKLYYTKVVMSLTPIRCKVGNLYFMEKKAKLTYVDWLFHGVVTLLLTS